MKNTQSKIKPIKIGKRPGTTYKDFTHNFRAQEVVTVRCLEKHLTALFVDQISQDF